MAIVAGVDFGTQSVRVSLFDSAKGRLGSAVAEYAVIRKREEPDHATQRHSDHMRALAEATRAALKAAGVDGAAVEALALDTTGSTVIPLGAGLEPLDDYYLWCDHRAKEEAAEIRATRWAWKLWRGAAACTRRNGAFQSCCTGCGTIPPSATSW